MKQTPVHDSHNPDLLAMLPANCRKIVEVGCSSGALAREYKRLNPGCRYLGIEIDADYAQLARRYCDEVFQIDVETLAPELAAGLGEADAWVFGDALEHLKDPWALLARVGQNLAATGCVVACIPNAQHWSVQARLCCGAFRYEDAGLLDRTHLRWFTRTTIIELFESTGFKIVEGRPRIFPEAQREKVLPAIRALAVSIGADPELAVSDALAIQYVIRAVRA